MADGDPSAELHVQQHAGAHHRHPSSFPAAHQCMYVGKHAASFASRWLVKGHKEGIKQQHGTHLRSMRTLCKRKRLMDIWSKQRQKKNLDIICFDPAGGTITVSFDIICFDSAGGTIKSHWTPEEMAVRLGR